MLELALKFSSSSIALGGAIQNHLPVPTSMLL
jgi:hypothetical protein